jgi:RNA polymerase sigma-70 factor (ECF subfamily)
VAQTVPTNPEAVDVRRAADGDHGAFERLYRLHLERVYALALRMTGEDLAEDLTQEVFIRAWQKLGSFRGDAQFGTWLHRLAVNHILSRRQTIRKREARQVTGPGIMERVLAPRRRASAEALDLDAAMAELPPKAKEVFVLYDVEGFTHDEIAQMTGITSGTSKSQLHRARMLLRERLA